MANTDLKNLIVTYRSNGLSYADIAEKLGTTAEYARTVYSRASKTASKNDSHKPNGFCKLCGKPLDLSGNRRNRLFCDDKCRSQYYNQKNLHTPFICVCKRCGREFVAYGNPNKHFCSRECQKLSGREG